MPDEIRADIICIMIELTKRGVDEVIIFTQTYRITLL